VDGPYSLSQPRGLGELEYQVVGHLQDHAAPFDGEHQLGR
jgi:hypothetical protein